MAKARRAKTSNTSKHRKRKNDIEKNILVVVMIVISILLAVLIYTKAGWVGEHLSPILGGIMGWMKYILPIGCFVLAIYTAKEEQSKQVGKGMQYIIFLICVASILSVYQISKGKINLNGEIDQILAEAYNLGSVNLGGGIIGALVAVPLTNLIGTAGAVILTAGIAMINLIFIFGIKPVEMIREMIENWKERREERYEEDDEEESDEILVENKKEKRKKKQKEKIQKQEKEEIELPMEDQITINLNEREPNRKKYKHDKDDLVPLTKESKEQEVAHPNTIEANLFKQEQEQKEEKTKEVLVLEHTLTTEEEHYEFPPIEFLSEGEGRVIKGGKKALADTATKLQKTLYSFGVSAKVENVSVGPAITRYEIKPAEGVRVSKIAKFSR